MKISKIPDVTGRGTETIVRVTKSEALWLIKELSDRLFTNTAGSISKVGDDNEWINFCVYDYKDIDIMSGKKSKR